MNTATPANRYAPSTLLGEAAPSSIFSQAGIGIFLLGVASGIPVQAVGRLYVGELILMAIAPVVVLLLFGLSDQYGRTARNILIAMAISWCGYVISDIIRGTPSNDYLRGWSRWIAMGATFATLAWLGSKNIRYLLHFLIGLAVGGCLTPFITGEGGIGIKVFWKFYAGAPICIIALIFVSQFRAWVSVATLLGLACLSIALDSRAHSLMLILTAGVTLIASRRSAHGLAALKPVSKSSMVLATILMAMVGIASIYLVQAVGARYGYAERFQRSNSSRLASATVAWSAIRASPFVGYGSWPRDAELAKQRDRLVAKYNGSRAFRTAASDDLVISHSQILQGWLEGGLLGLTFFALLLWYLSRQLLWQTLVSPYMSLTPIMVFIQLEGALNLIFSPFSGAQRVYIPATCVFICYIAQKKLELERLQRPAISRYLSPRGFPQTRAMGR